MKNLVLTLSVLVSTVSIAQDTVVQIESYPPTHNVREMEQMSIVEQLGTVFYPITATKQIKGVEDYTVGAEFQSTDMTKVLYSGNTYSFYTFNTTKENMVKIISEFILVTRANGVDIEDPEAWDERSYADVMDYSGSMVDFDSLYSKLKSDKDFIAEFQMWFDLPDGTPVWVGVKVDPILFEFRLEVDPA